MNKSAEKPTPPPESASLEAENADLHAALKDARAKNQAQKDLLALASHEIKTPVGGILSMVEFLETTPLTTTQAHYLKTLALAAETISNTSEDMQDFACLQSGQVGFKQEPINLRELLSSLALSLATRAEAKGLSFTAQMDQNVPELVYSDQGRLHQIINNLGNNALKFTDQGRISLTVSADLQNPEAPNLTIAINDTGIGIREADQQKIFDPFTQIQNNQIQNKPGQNNQSPQETGSGLGLWISSQIAKGLNGALSCNSKPQQGSTFKFTFTPKLKPNELARESQPDHSEVEAPYDAKIPATTQPPPLPPRMPSALKQTDLPSPPIPLSPSLKGHVLVVEDNQLNQMLIKEYLDKFGLTYELAENGLAALMAVELGAFDCILMDIMMPEMDGLTAAKEMHKRWDESQHIPIIALSASANETNFEEYKTVGIEGYVAKPIRGEPFFQTLTEHLPNRDQESPAKSTPNLKLITKAPNKTKDGFKGNAAETKTE